jgi:hypothetical protein
MSLPGPWLEAEELSALRLGLCAFALPAEDFAEVVVARHGLRIKPEGFPISGHRLG